MSVRTIPAGEFKAKCLALMDEVAASGDEIVVTKRGRPMVRIKAEERNDPYSQLEGSVRWRNDEDLIGPENEPWPGDLDDD
ncbi:MAG: type II toxin-antitoxin system Phd/YefM family antitoxin [Dehalococcoidia bacterium]